MNEKLVIALYLLILENSDLKKQVKNLEAKNKYLEGFKDGKERTIV